MTDKYILDGKTAVQCKNLMEWAQWFETANRKVADDKVNDVRISTVFLGLDHSFTSGAPVLFETMVFGGPLDQEMDRYSTWEDAEMGHLKMLHRVRQAS